MSCGAISAFSVRSLYALAQISVFLLKSVACPCSSKAMTTMAAPSLWISLALPMNASSPSFRLMELTIDFPWAFLSPERIVFQSEESIMRAAFAAAGSLEMLRTNLVISASLSSMASSMLMSIMSAPLSTCPAAIPSASVKLPEAISLANFLEPATLVLSPTLVKFLVLRSMHTASSPLTVRGVHCLPSGLSMPRVSLSSPGIFLAGNFLTAASIALMYSGVVPQHPPAIFSSPSAAICPISTAISSGVWAYPPIPSGRPAFG